MRRQLSPYLFVSIVLALSLGVVILMLVICRGDDSPDIIMAGITASDNNAIVTANKNVNIANTNAMTNENTNATTTANADKNLNILVDESPDYHFTDAIENPVNGYSYMIRKDKGETFCGVNGSGRCDLIEERNGKKYKIADLFFSNSPEVETRLQGAELIKFDDASTLIIQYSSFDHGGSQEAIYSYDIESGELSKRIKIMSAESSTCGEYDVDLYRIEKGDNALLFVNCGEVVSLENGVYVETDGNTSSLTTNFSQPYTVNLNVINNYLSDSEVVFDVNSSEVGFDFSEKQFIK